MNFKRLTLFNKAMVAKQGWRLISNPSSLMSRVLKAKYFRLSNPLDVSVGSNVSFVWRSICWGLELIKAGTRWKVGNGSKINF